MIARLDFPQLPDTDERRSSPSAITACFVLPIEDSLDSISTLSSIKRSFTNRAVDRLFLQSSAPASRRGRLQQWSGIRTIRSCASSIYRRYHQTRGNQTLSQHGHSSRRPSGHPRLHRSQTDSRRHDNFNFLSGSPIRSCGARRRRSYALVNPHGDPSHGSFRLAGVRPSRSGRMGSGEPGVIFLDSITGPTLRHSSAPSNHEPMRRTAAAAL